jgi:glycosyltransferase involved in cell wall biosynthesis
VNILHLVGDRQLPRNPESQGSSGIVRSALEIARAQAAIGHSVEVAGTANTQWRSSWQGVQLISLPITKWAQLHMRGLKADFRDHLPYIWRTHRRRYDVVHGHNYLYLKFLRAPIRVAHVQTDPFYAGSSATKAFSDADFEALLRGSTVQVAPGQFVATQLERGLQGRGNIRVVPNGVDHERFSPTAWRVSARKYRQAWGAGDDDVVVLYSGAIVPHKGVIHLARAFRRLSEENAQIHLVVAGASGLWGGSALPRAEHNGYDSAVQAELARSLDQRKVHLLGAVPSAELPGVYAACDVVVIPSTWQDPFPLVALESIAMGRPIIASRAGGLPEIVTTECGILVSPGDEQELQGAMTKLIADRDLRQALGAAGEDRAMQFSWRRAATQLDSIYRIGLSGEHAA